MAAGMVASGLGVHRRRARSGRQRASGHGRPPGQLDLRRRSLAGELKRYALTYLGDPELSPQAAAHASYISARQFHRLFAADGTSFAAWVREQRLRRCRDDLASQQLSHRAIAEIATRRGFRSPAHFTRAFRARYGITPAGLRRTTRTAGHRSP